MIIQRFTLLFMLAFACLSHSMVQAGLYSGVNLNANQLGRGFDSQLSALRNHCVMGEIVTWNNTEADISYAGLKSHERYLEETYGRVKGGVNLVLFAGSVSASLSTRVTENSRTSASSIKLLYHATDRSIENRKLSPYGAAVLTQDEIAIDELCGSEFIHHLKLGLEISVTTKLHFRSIEDYQRWVTKVKVRFLFYSKTKTKTKEWLELTENAVYSIEINAKGGMTDRLQAILDENTVFCVTSNIDACIDTTSRLFEYLFSEMGYIVDIRDAPKQVISFSTTPYLISGHLELALPPNAEVNQYRFQDERIRTRLYANQQMKEALYAFAQVEADEAIRVEFLARVSLIEENIELLDQAAALCRTSTDWLICERAVDEALYGQTKIEY
ncbi:hypothetical protein OAC77_03995 [Reinekea forsetii]|nr:hypothetical protein [Reinekea forsetii]